MLSNENILVELNGGALCLTFNRPERLNVLDMETRKELVAVLKAHEGNESVKCVVISSKGNVFSAGADLNYILGLTPAKAAEYAEFVRTVLDYVEAYPKPTIGLVNGTAVGGALELLLTLDLLIATSNAKFGLTELNVGLIPGGGGSQRLPRMVGIRKAKQMIFTGSLISADEALARGLVNMVVSEDALAKETRKLCERIESKSATGLRLAKLALNHSLHKSLEEGLRQESTLYETVVSSTEAKERIRKFLEKRKVT